MSQVQYAPVEVQKETKETIKELAAPVRRLLAALDAERVHRLLEIRNSKRYAAEWVYCVVLCCVRVVKSYAVPSTRNRRVCVSGSVCVSRTLHSRLIGMWTV